MIDNGVREIVNAQITDTFLGIEDHGIFTFFIHTKSENGGQSYGGFSLDCPVHKDGKFIKRLGSAFGSEAILRILGVVGVDSWEKLKGKYIRLDRTWQHTYRIGNIIEDKWLDLKELANEFKDGD